MRNRLTERDLSRIVRRVINEQEDPKNKLIKVLKSKLESMESDPNFDADSVCEVIVNNCNHYKNKTDIFSN